MTQRALTKFLACGLLAALAVVGPHAAGPSVAGSTTVSDAAGDSVPDHDLVQARFVHKAKRFSVLVTKVGAGPSWLHLSIDPGRRGRGGYFVVSNGPAPTSGSHPASVAYVKPGKRFGPRFPCRGARVRNNGSSVALSAPLSCLNTRERVTRKVWAAVVSVTGEPQDLLPEAGGQLGWVRVRR